MRPIVAITLALLGVSTTASATYADQARHGGALYERYCQQCHGANLAGYAADNAPSLVSPTFRETADDSFLRSAIERGRAGTAMGGYGAAFGGPLEVGDVNALIAYIRGDSHPIPMARRPSSGSPTKGAQLYAAHCETCHGTPRQRNTAVHLANAMFLDTASDAYLRAAIERGRPGTPMQAWSGKLSPEEIEDVVAYLRSLAGPVPAPPNASKRELISLENVPIVINPDGPQANFKLRDDEYVSVDDVGRAYAEKKRMVIIDARVPSDYLRLHITGAISIPHFDMRDLDKVPNDGTWVIAYCACPHHVSGIVRKELQKRGYPHTAVLDEGVFDWQEKGYPVTRAAGQLPVAKPPGSPAPLPSRRPTPLPTPLPTRLPTP